MQWTCKARKASRAFLTTVSSVWTFGDQIDQKLIGTIWSCGTPNLHFSAAYYKRVPSGHLQSQFEDELCLWPSHVHKWHLNRRISGSPYLVHLDLVCKHMQTCSSNVVTSLSILGVPRFWAPPYLLPKLMLDFLKYISVHVPPVSCCFFSKCPCLSCLPELSGRLGPDLVCPHGLFQPRSL